MGLFSGNKEDELSKKDMKVLEKYNLDMLTNREDLESVRKIVTELMGTGMMEFGARLGGGSEKDVLKLQSYYLRAMVEQNFIIIRQLDRLTSAIGK